MKLDFDERISRIHRRLRTVEPRPHDAERVHRLDSLFHAWALKGKSRDPREPVARAPRRARAVSTRGALGELKTKHWLQASGVVRLLARPGGWRGMRRGAECGFPMLRQKWTRRREAISLVADFIAQKTTSGARSRYGGPRVDEWPRASRRSMTTTTRSWSRRSRTLAEAFRRVPPREGEAEWSEAGAPLSRKKRRDDP